MRERVKFFKAYAKRFAGEESGMELLQMAIVLAVTVGLIGVVKGLGDMVSRNISNASNNADAELGSIIGTGTGN